MAAVCLAFSIFELAAAKPGCAGESAQNIKSDPGNLLLQRSSRSLDPEIAGSPVEEKNVVAFASVQANKKVLPVGWFGGFSEGESTFNSDAEDNQVDFPERDAIWEPGLRADIRTPDGLTPAWFHESPSGGPNQVWQTHYPYLDDVADRSFTPPWRRTVNGRWQQQYKPPRLEVAQNKAASWFDSGVEQYDSYGRVREPRDRTGRRYAVTREAIINGSLACNEPGCTASSLVRVHGPGGNARCSLSLWLNPTDYDDEHSKEELEWVKINGEIVNAHCDPMVKSCGNGTNVVPATFRYQCMDHLHINHLLRSGDGLISVEAKITSMVDECPIGGSLLKGDFQFTCHVEDPPPTLPPPPTPKPLGCTDRVPVRCRNPGCTASNLVRLDPSKFPNGTCTLVVNIYQTDFDSDHGSEEQVDAIWVNDELVMLSCKPGGNPCKQPNVTTWSTCVGSYDVSKYAADGAMLITVKISDKVDECGHNGFLLDAEVSVECSKCIDPAFDSNGRSPPIHRVVGPLGGWTPGVLGPGAWSPGGRPGQGGLPPNESAPGAPEVFPKAKTPVQPWTCKCRKRTSQGVTTRECRKNGYLVAECTDPIPTEPPGAPQPTWPPGWNKNARPDRLKGDGGFETNQTQFSKGYTCACRNGTKIVNGTRTQVRQCIKNGCLVDNCKERIDVNNCTVIESWNQCDCRIVSKAGKLQRECRLRGRVVEVCPRDENATVQSGNLSNLTANVTTPTPTMFLEGMLDSSGKSLEPPGEGLQFKGRDKAQDPLVRFEDWEDQEIPEFVSELVS